MDHAVVPDVCVELSLAVRARAAGEEVGGGPVLQLLLVYVDGYDCHTGGHHRWWVPQKFTGDQGGFQNLERCLKDDLIFVIIQDAQKSFKRRNRTL